jgi:hypothetical protein
MEEVTYKRSLIISSISHNQLLTPASIAGGSTRTEQLEAEARASEIAGTLSGLPSSTMNRI